MLLCPSLLLALKPACDMACNHPVLPKCGVLGGVGLAVAMATLRFPQLR